MWPFRRRAAPSPPALSMVEGAESFHIYHLRDGQARSSEGLPMALCGNTHIMASPCGLDLWGFHGQARERYCVRCDEAARARGQALRPVPEVACYRPA